MNGDINAEIRVRTSGTLYLYEASIAAVEVKVQQGPGASPIRALRRACRACRAYRGSGTCILPSDERSL